jgi:hypothetical protein
MLAWDAIDEKLARMHGFRTRTFEYLVAIHHRPWGSAEGTLRGRGRYGTADYVARSPIYWAVFRSLKFTALRPRGIGGLAYLFGYCRAALRRTPRFGDGDFRRAVRREIHGRMLSKLPLTSRAGTN